MPSSTPARKEISDERIITMVALLAQHAVFRFMPGTQASRDRSRIRSGVPVPARTGDATPGRDQSADSQRAALQAAIQQAQSNSSISNAVERRGEKLARLLQGPLRMRRRCWSRWIESWRPTRGEATQIGLLVRIKNALTPVQQAKLAKLGSSAVLGALTPRPSGRA